MNKLDFTKDNIAQYPRFLTVYNNIVYSIFQELTWLNQPWLIFNVTNELYLLKNHEWVCFQDLDSTHPSLHAIYTTFEKAYIMLFNHLNIEQPKINECICTSWNLYHYGCKCGFLSKKVIIELNDNIPF